MSTVDIPDPFSVKPPPVSNSDWFRRFPNGGTVHLPEKNHNHEVSWFRRVPNGGGTVFQGERAFNSTSE